MRNANRLCIALCLAGTAGCAAGAPAEDFGTLYHQDLATERDGDEGRGRLHTELGGATAVAPTGEFVPNGDEPGYHPEPLYAVVLVESGDVLNVRAEPGADQEIVDRLAPESIELTGTGRDAMAGGSRWVEVLTASATGWVNAHYLTEFVTPARFCADDGIADLLTDLDRAIRTSDGERLFGLTSPAHGLTVHVVPGSQGVHYDDAAVRSLFRSDEAVEWGIHPYSGVPVTGAFKDIVLPDLTAVLTSEAKRSECNTLVIGASAAEASWPSEYGNFNFYTLHIPGTDEHEGMDWKSWVVGIEYVEGIPYVFALQRFAR